MYPSRLLNELTMENKKVSIDYSDVTKIVVAVVLPHGWKSLIPGYNLYKILVEPLARKVIESANLTSDSDIDNIKEIIRAGKENNVDELEIKLNKDLGIDIGTDLNSVGIPVDAKFKVGSKGETVINVKYK